MKKKFLSLLLALFASIGVALADDSGTCGVNLQWSYNSTTHALTITGSGAMTNWSWSSTSSAPWSSYSSEITSVSLPNGLTSIGSYAFYNCRGLTSVTIPNSVTSIGSYAFYNCRGLTSVTIPNSVTSIGESAFYFCTTLTSIVWNATNCTHFSNYSSGPFYYIRSQITSFTFGDNVQRIPAYLCSDMTNLTSITIPDSVTGIGGGAFSGCTGLTNVNIPNSVTSIGEEAFYGCTGLTSVTIPNSVTSIGEYAFKSCTGLTNVTIPNSVTTIGQSAFSGCIGITQPLYNSHVFAFMPASYVGSYQIPDGIESIAGYSFQGCIGLTNITLPEGVTSIGYSAFSGCTGLTSVTIPNSVTSIESAFYGCTDITKITWNTKQCNEYSYSWLSPFYEIRTILNIFEFGEDVEKIPAYLCYEMTNLTSVSIPNSVTNIGERAFDGCTYLQKVVLGNGINSIGNSAFANCTYLAEVTANMQFPPLIDVSVFTGCGDLSEIPCFVPKNSLTQYRKTNVWKSFKLIGVEAAGVSTEETSATITAPFSTGDVSSYSLTLYYQGEVFCTLSLDAEGHLTGIDFAQPQQRVAAFATSVNGLNIPITGLQPGTTYTYTLDALDSNGNIIERHAGEFTTEGSTALENVSADGASGVRKVIEDGKVIILMPDGRKFDASGKFLK